MNKVERKKYLKKVETKKDIALLLNQTHATLCKLNELVNEVSDLKHNAKGILYKLEKELNDLSEKNKKEKSNIGLAYNKYA